MTLDQLRVLLAIRETGSFRAASEKLHRAQSAVSYAIKNLEEELNIRIFDRESYRPQLTSNGQAIYQKAKEVVIRADELEELGNHLSQGLESEIKLAINAIGPLDKVIQVINSFSKSNPMTRVLLNIENLGGSVERILDGDADIALAEMVERNDELDGVKWASIEFIPVAAPHFPPAKTKSRLTKSDMARWVQIIVSDTSRHSQRKTVGVLEEGIHWTVNDFSIKRKLLVGGSGWGLMPKHLVETELETGALKVLNYQPFPQNTVDFFLIRRKEIPMGPVTTSLWNQLKSIGNQGL